MRRRSWVVVGAALLSLGVASEAWSGARKLPTYDLSSDKGMKKAAKTFGYTTEGKVGAFPKKVAISSFQIRYRFQSPVSVSSDMDSTTYSTYTLQLSDDDYTTMTDMLYDEFVSQMTAEGFDVVPKDQLLASKAYQALEGDVEAKESGKRALYAASGMKNLKTRNGEVVDRDDFAAINQELGADASVAVFADIGICDVTPTAKHTGGILPCLYGALLQYPGLNLQFIGGAVSKGAKVKPDWDFRVYKDIAEWKYGGKDVYDAAFFGTGAAMTPGRRSFWHGRAWDAQSEAFIEGGADVFADALKVALWELDTKAAKQRAKAGVEKRAAPPVVPPEPPAPVVHEVTALPGTETCFFGPVQVTAGGKVVAGYDTLVRRAVDGASIVDDSVVFTPSSTLRYVTRYAVSGTTLDGKETAGTWTVAGTATDASLTTWDAKFTLPAGGSVDAHYTIGADGLHITTHNFDAKGAETASSQQDLALLDQAACYEKLKTAPMPKGGF